MQITGSSRATVRAKAARSAASTTAPTALHAPGASSATPRIERLRIKMTYPARFSTSYDPRHCRKGMKAIFPAELKRETALGTIQ
jgi:hypothetical protein